MSLSNSSAPGGYYQGSALPAGRPWYEYNYCNAPHLSAAHYQLPQEKDVELIYVTSVQRHAKRTPDNIYPQEGKIDQPSWDCANFLQYNNGQASNGNPSHDANMYHVTDIPDWHPLLSTFWNGTCDSGQLTAGGLRDAVKHGEDFYSVYGPNGAAPILKRGINQKDLLIRTSTEDRTYQVSGGLLAGMGYHGDFPAHTLPESLDSIPPSYSCAYADDLRTKINAEAAFTDHLKSKQALFDSLNAVVGTADSSAWNSWIDHHFDAMASRQCNGHPLPKNATTGVQISQDLANEAYAEGDWEYNYIWNASPNADAYVRYSIGVFVAELARDLRAVLQGKQAQKVKLFVGHDGTMVRLLKTLAQSGQIRWPALGSEVVFEVWKDKKSKLYTRIFSYGRVLYSDATALTGANGTAEATWAPLDGVVKYLEGRVPQDLLQKCTSG